MLVAVEAQVGSVEIVLRLEALGERAGLLVSQVRLEEEPWHDDSEKAEDWEGGVLLGDHPVFQGLFETLEEGFGVHWLGINHLVISWKSVIFDHSL